MKYLAYYEVIETSGWKLSEDLNELKGAWCFNMRIFETPDLTQEELDNMEKPRYPKIARRYELIHKDGTNLFHEKEIEDEAQENIDKL